MGQVLVPSHYSIEECLIREQFFLYYNKALLIPILDTLHGNFLYMVYNIKPFTAAGTYGSLSASIEL